MAVTVTNSNPGRITSVGTTPSYGSVSVTPTTPGSVTIGSNYGMQGMNGYSTTPVTLSGVGTTPPSVNNPAASIDYAKLLADALSGSGGASGPVAAPYYDITGNRAAAKTKAEGAQNPYYDKQLTNFLAGSALKKQQAQDQAGLQLKTLQDTLKQQLDSSELGRVRTTEDTALSRDQATNTFNQNNEASATANDQARIDQARQLFVQGTLNSGVGRGTQKRTQADRLLAEQQAAEAFDRTRNTQELFKSRTFEDLAKSDELANLGYTRGKEATEFDLASYIANQAIYDEAQTLQLEHERQAQIAADTENFYKIALNNWIASIKDPRQLQAARTAYGG